MNGLWRNLTVFAIIALSVSMTTARKSSFSAPIQSTGDGPVYYIDHASFQGLDNKTYVEFYIQIGHKDLQFYKNGNKFEAGYNLEFELQNSQGETVESHSSVDVFQVDTFTETISGKKARISLIAFTIDPGDYVVKSTLRDLETLRTTTITQSVIASDFSANELVISDLQLSQKIEPAPEGAPYVKNQRYIEPNAVRLFAHGLTDIYVYFEVYNLLQSETCSKNNYVAHFIIKREDGSTMAHLKRKHNKPGATSAHSIKLPIEHFQNGHYALTVRVEDGDTGNTSETSTSFTVLDTPVALNALVPESIQ